MPTWPVINADKWSRPSWRRSFRLFRAEIIPFAVALYVVAGYWFTASTCFANPAVAIARSMTNTFSGIRPVDAPWFILAEIVGALLAMALFRWLLRVSAPVSAGPSLAGRRAPLDS